jgi:hypothetical protein
MRDANKRWCGSDLMNIFSTRNRSKHGLLGLWVACTVLISCGNEFSGSSLDNDVTETGRKGLVYDFTSRFDASSSSVEYDGPILRHLLIGEMKRAVGELDPSVQTYVPGEVTKLLQGYYAYNPLANLNLPITLTLPSKLPQRLQDNLQDIGSHANLKQSIAGQNTKAWAPSSLAGWPTSLDGQGDAAIAHDADALVSAIIHAIDRLAVLHSEGNAPRTPKGEVIQKVFVDESAIDYQQLLQKFLLGAVTFSEGSAEMVRRVRGYVDEESKRVEPADNSLPYEQAGQGLLFTAMEHAVDQAYGAFGAARNYGQFRDEEIAGKGGRDDWQLGNDGDGDAMIDLRTEYNFGHSQNAAKRDMSGALPNDFADTLFNAFYDARRLIADTQGSLETHDRELLEDTLGVITETWEKVQAATVVHYINEVIEDLDTDTTPFTSYAKHWSELKGFALGLQFNPSSPLWVTLDAVCFSPGSIPMWSVAVSEQECDAGPEALWDPAESGFERIHRYIGDRPVLTSSLESRSHYLLRLDRARHLFAQIYNFPEATLTAW